MSSVVKVHSEEKKQGEKYQPATIEKKWQKVWEESQLFTPDIETAKHPFYNLMMFPYPSAEGMHVGNMYAFTGADVYARFKRMQGNDVFEPIGLDGFGIHAENYALKIGKNPMDQAKVTQENFYRQFRSTGNSYDYTRTLETYDVDYYRWTQWLFVQMYKKGLAYRKKAPVNFCPSCKTVLADEQVIDGNCERCSSIVEKRELEQWFFKITDYAERLLNNIPKLNWTEKVKIAQREWIGRSEGVRLEFRIKNSELRIQVFTTALDTIFGVTFMVISPEHPLVSKLLMPEFKNKGEAYIKGLVGKSEIERTSEGKEKTGVFTGSYAISPFTGEEIPVWIADYVVMGYGTGVVMGVPGHDARDHEFAQRFEIEIKPVIKPAGKAIGKATVEKDGFWNYAAEIKNQFKEDSELFNSGKYDGMTSRQAKAQMEKDIKVEGWGEKVVNYHLRDWLISRQRYWGPPIPMIYCEKCGWNPVLEKDLPVKLPYIEDYKPLGSGVSPLASHPEFYKTTCPICGGEARRETDVSDTFLDSSWYFFRYPCTDIDSAAFDTKRLKKWLPVNMYIGGAEHSVLHLLYSRFITMVLKDLGYIDFEEPFSRFYAHGLIIKEGAKMSKSKGNVVVPDEYIKKFGADTLRLYLMFLGPFSSGGDFRDSGIEGMYRFVRRIWILVNDSGKELEELGEKEGLERRRFMHKTIKKVTEDIEKLHYNTAIAALMEWYNYLSQKSKVKSHNLTKEEAETFLKLLAPFAPYMTEELWHMDESINHQAKRAISDKQFQSIHLQAWPSYEQKYLEEDEVTIVVQVNGKARGIVTSHKSQVTSQEVIEQLARKSTKVQQYLEGKAIRKVMYVAGKVINFVVEV